MTDLSNVRAAARHLASTRRRVADAEEKFANTIRAALAEGHGATVIAAAAGISRARVYQIRNEER